MRDPGGGDVLAKNIENGLASPHLPFEKKKISKSPPLFKIHILPTNIEKFARFNDRDEYSRVFLNSTKKKKASFFRIFHFSPNREKLWEKLGGAAIKKNKNRQTY